MGVTGIIIVRGGGDIASGTIHRLHSCGGKVLVLERQRPTAIRRGVAFSEAVYDGDKTVEGVTAQRIIHISEMDRVWAQDRVPLLVDPQAECLAEIRPQALVDAILAKRNCGTSKLMGRITVALGPGFCAGKDVHAVVETLRGHDLGRVIYTGEAAADTGIPGALAGVTAQRVVYAPCSGRLVCRVDIGARVRRQDVLGSVAAQPIYAPVSGVVRGLLRPGLDVVQGMKLADIDPRPESQKNCFSISDKARCVSGGVLEALWALQQQKEV